MKINFTCNVKTTTQSIVLYCATFLNFNNIAWIKSPLKSSYLNPIELMRNELKQHVRKRMILSETDAEMTEIKVILEKNENWSNHRIILKCK
ncbi:hypothetical protein BpHYR1_033817 [Brachionus plicatilis]|uniref:Tc1-like transposase DDE domain-containing protein n=1 Tax=Brachionus plicatilis TaxID=10195 RepID=A0A3M7PFL9_BRAPC|nr:hypothetical protein BpHYR1_033817 [Brachionus plicatilis]